MYVLTQAHAVNGGFVLGLVTEFRESVPFASLSQ